MDRYLITGASRGIGRSIAVALASKNSEILIHGRDEKELDKTAQLVEERAGKATKIAADISNFDGVNHLIKETGTQPLKALINNAGIAIVNKLPDITLEEWDKTFFVNVTAPFLLTKYLLPYLHKESSIVNILSKASHQGFPEWSVYCMSKYAMEGFTQSIKLELQSRGIRIINIYPGSIKTDIWDDIPGEWNFDNMMSPDVVADAVKFALDRPQTVLIDNLTLRNYIPDKG